VAQAHSASALWPQAVWGCTLPTVTHLPCMTCSTCWTGTASQD